MNAPRSTKSSLRRLLLLRSNLLRKRQEPLLAEETVQASVTFALAADEACHCEGVEFASVAAILVHLAHVQLNRAVLLGRNETVRHGALPWQVEIDNLALFVLHCK